MLADRLSRESLLALLPQATAHSEEVAQRLLWFLHYAEHRSVNATCRHFTIARTTFYRWANRFDPRDLRSLEDRPIPHPFSTSACPPAPTGPRGEVSAAPALQAVSPLPAPQDGTCSRVLRWFRAHWPLLRRVVFAASLAANGVFLLRSV